MLVLGAAAGAFVLGVTVVVAENVGRSGPVVALAVVLTLCMGVAEVQIATARDQLDATLRRSTTTVEFTRTARRVLAGHSLGFLAVLVLALGVTAGVTDLDAGAAAAVASTMVLLGWCLYLNLCLLIIEHVAPALVAFCGAAILLTALLALSEDVGHVVIGVAAVAAGGLWLSVRSSVARPEGHVFG